MTGMLAQLSAVYQWPLPEEKTYVRHAKKGLDKEGEGVAWLLVSTGETPIVAANARDGLAVVTDRRTIEVKRGKIQYEVAHANVRQTRLMKHPGLGSFVIIEGSPTIQVWVLAFSIANTFAVTIDRLAGAS